MLTSTGEYAIRAMIHIAAHVGAQRFVQAREIGADCNIPERYLSKILGTLTRKGLLEAQRGRGGGFCLRRPATQITIYQILDSVDRTDQFQSCVLGLPECNPHEPCALHKYWIDLKLKILDLFKGIHLASLLPQSGNAESSLKILSAATQNPRASLGRIAARSQGQTR